MTSTQRTVDAVRDEIIAATAEVRAVAKSEHDEARTQVADWLDGRFAGVTDDQDLHEASAEALSLYRGGMGSFQDVGSSASAHVVGELYVALQRGRTLRAEPVDDDLPFATDPGGGTPMGRRSRTVQAVRQEIIAAIAEVRAAALLSRDERRAHTADWLDQQFADITDRRGLREASAQALTLYRGGMGSFRDVGYETAGHAVDRLHPALRRGRSWFLRGSY